MSDSEFMSMEEAIAHVMRATGKNRRQAKAALLEKVRTGELPLTGIGASGKREDIPPGDYIIRDRDDYN